MMYGLYVSLLLCLLLKIGDVVIVAVKAVVVGNPAKIIKMRFDDNTIRELLKIKWWSWPREKITKNIIGLDIEKLKNAK